MIKRSEALKIQESLGKFPAVGILGPRQVGKTTLAKQLGRLFPDSVYLDFENPDHLARVADPTITLRPFQDQLVILDEVQRRPELFPVLRALIDENRIPGRFLILGSASPDLLRQSSESLAGRIRYHELQPFNLFETGNQISMDTLWFRGGYPASLLSMDDPDAMEWLETFIRTFLERDLNDLEFSLPAVQLRRFWTMLAHSHGQQFNASRLGVSLGVSDRTVRRWLDVLTDTFMVRQIQPWLPNIGKRVVKAPKIYLSDSGIVHRLLGINSMDDLLFHPACGHSWEGFVLQQIMSMMPFLAEVYHYRTYRGAEIDLLLKLPGRSQLTAVEIKRSFAPKVQRGFWNAMEDTECDRAFVIYPGDDSWPIAENVNTLPLTQLPLIFE
ncbi:ATP-binding protein [Pontiellaceae bacterium B12227]|nr:ATP-binding protein [Pontiellaceae bacterium B12227]